MKRRINFARSLTLPIFMVVVVFVSPVRPAHSKAVVKPDLPLGQLLALAATDINQFWLTNFTSTRRLYLAPGLVSYTQPIQTPCGRSEMNNAFYCSASNSIYFDNNFLTRVYNQVGDYAAVSIIAHEWGHVVQTQLGMSNGRFFSIQMELQADCFAGSYTKYAELRGELEEGDMEEAGVGLFNSGDPKGMPWFAPQAHGKAMQRISSFLDGYKQRPCFGT